MNLPHITAEIGKQTSDGKDPLAMLYKDVKANADKDLYDVFLNFDLNKNAIYFAEKVAHSSESAAKYRYLGNNSAAGMQYYIVREGKSSGYILRSMFNDLAMELEKQKMDGSELYRLLEELQENGLIEYAGKKGEGRINLDKFVDSSSFENVSVEAAEKKNIACNGENMSYDKFTRKMADMEEGSVQAGFVIPRVITKDGEEIVISMHEDYKELIMRSKNLKGCDSIGNQDISDKSKCRTCFICRQEKEDVKCSEYMSKLSRTGINKIFTTTTINSAKNIDKKKYEDSYAVCAECYRNLVSGEKYINENLTVRMAGERTFLVPEEVIGDFNFKYIERLKREVDMCFNPREVKNFMEGLEAEFKMDNENGHYNLNFVVNRTDGNSVNVLEVIEDVPFFHFQRVNEILKEKALNYEDYIKGLSMGSIYHMVPVRSNKSGDQLDVQKVLSLYKSILGGRQVKASQIFKYAAQAIGIEMKKEREFEAKKLIFEYMAFLNALSDMGILDRQELKRGKELMDERQLAKENSIEGVRRFLDDEGFDREARSLFYVGALMKSVANAQYSSNHKKKPILGKIRFQGMNKNEVKRLYSDIVEKLRQYDKMTYFNEMLMKDFHINFGKPDGAWSHGDCDNVFYIMAGYAFMTKNFETDENKQNQSEQGEE